MVLATKPSRPTNLHHRKRHGEHHKKSQHYTKPYWPYLPLLAIVGLGIVINMVWSSPDGVLGTNANIGLSSLLEQTNEERGKQSQAGLSLNSQLTTAAQAKAEDMAARNYWSHDTPDGTPPWTFITKAGYNYQNAGENLAYGFTSSNAVVQGWMNSTEHRGNILNQQYGDVGFGIASSKNFQNSGPQTIIVALYGKSVGVATATQRIDTAIPSNEVGVTSPARTATLQPETQRVARIQILTSGHAPWSLFAISALSAVAIIWLVLRHGLLLRRAIVYSETFIVRHRMLDVVVISIATFGFILTRTAGLIR